MMHNLEQGCGCQSYSTTFECDMIIALKIQLESDSPHLIGISGSLISELLLGITLSLIHTFMGAHH
jgi:hypothetical protein